MPLDGLVLVRNTTPETQDSLGGIEEQRDITLRATFAQDAVEKVFEWLAYSPNNPQYLTSETYRLPKEWLEAHANALREDVTEGLQTISDENQSVDLYRMEMLRDGTVVHRNQFTNQLEPLPQLFAANDFANAGIKEIIQQAEADTAESGVTTINEHAVRAIGAMLLRGAYFNHLSQLHPEALSEHDRDTFLATFRQNILATIFTAARLSAAAATNEQQSSLPTSGSRKAAA